jgi:DTW domain-containing protein YfiP
MMKTVGIYESPNPMCSRCEKLEGLCVCSEIDPFANRMRIGILQHPRENDEKLGTARLAQLTLENSFLRVGLSWPNLKKAVGDAEAKPSDWAILYIGTGVRLPNVPREELPRLYEIQKDKSFARLPLGEPPFHGVLVLDGTWAQAKALWWRNAWMSRLRRLALVPSRQSLYGNLRKEPRKECVSTLEAISDTLVALGESAEVRTKLERPFQSLLQKIRETEKHR